MICVAKDDRQSLENVPKWRREIQEIEPAKPIALIVTKWDIAHADGKTVDDRMIRGMKNQMGFAMSGKTSSQWYEIVQYAFDTAFYAAYGFKYGLVPKKERGR